MKCSKCNAETAAQCVENNCHWLERDPDPLEERIAALEIEIAKTKPYALLLDAWVNSHGKPIPWKKAIAIGEVLKEFSLEQAEQLRSMD